MEGLLLDSESIHGVATSISYEEHSTTLYQIFTLSPPVTFEQLRAAIKKTVKLITSINDVAISFLYFGRYGSNSTFRNITKIIYSARLPGSKSAMALTRLNNISDKMFSSNISTFLGVPVTVKTSEKWYVSDYLNWKWPGQDDGKEPALPLFTSKNKRMSFTSALLYMVDASPECYDVSYTTVHYLTHHT